MAEKAVPRCETEIAFSFHAQNFFFLRARNIFFTRAKYFFLRAKYFFFTRAEREGNLCLAAIGQALHAARISLANHCARQMPK